MSPPIIIEGDQRTITIKHGHAKDAFPKVEHGPDGKSTVITILSEDSAFNTLVATDDKNVEQFRAPAIGSPDNRMWHVTIR